MSQSKYQKLLSGIVLVLFVLVNHTAVLAGEVEFFKTEDGIEYALWNHQVRKPAPVIITFATTMENTLGNPYYRQCANMLAKEGFIALSVDLPRHGQFRVPNEPDGLAGWRKACEQKENFVKEVTGRVSAVLDHLIDKGVADPKRIAACGTSRGGFIALHLAASDPRISCVVAYAPVIQLGALREFEGMEDDPFVKQLSLLDQVSRFQEKKVWLVIGDRDTRVNTDHSVHFIRGITRSALKNGKEPLAELHVLPEPKGHTTPRNAPENSAKWVLETLEIN